MTQLAYLVIREGTKWSDVFRLVPGHSVKVGRAPTNQVVVEDERCSREHFEVFMSQGQWYLRDLDSRNGTLIDDRLVTSDWPLEPGNVIRIGRTQLVFVHRISDAFSDSGISMRPGGEPERPRLRDTVDDDSHVLATFQPPTITHRRGSTKFLGPSRGDETSATEAGEAAARLCRIAFQLAQADNIATMADYALRGLLEGTRTDAAALLLVPQDFQGQPLGDDLEVVASLSDSNKKYHRISTFLASTVLREGEAVLARNIMGDSSLGSRDSQGEIYTTSVVCAPVRHGKTLLGLVHLYSTDEREVPTPEDLEYTLAVADTIAVALNNLNRRQQLADNLTQVQTENVQLRERLGVQSEIIGQSEAIRRVDEEIERAASTDATVLIRGESGVGKELVARAVHYNSPRRERAFVCLNCAALAEDLLASELFGHERGAFTGATDRKIGKFEAADRGTLMLDEIGEMSLGIQAKFLRVLEGHPFERVGGNKPVRVNVRVIAATNRDLERDVAEGRFRRDLFFRLRVVELIVPPLRDRTEDILELADFFLDKFKTETGRRIDCFTQAARDRLVGYSWPGNVRELKNVVERAVVLCRAQEIDVNDLLLSRLSVPEDEDREEKTATSSEKFSPASLADLERIHILETLRHTEWNKSRTASILGIERSTLDRKIRRYKIRRDS